MMCGWLLARSGVDVVVLEKHEDFFRDFRGDTIHPATLQLLAELGAIDDFLALPHSKMERLTMETPSGSVTFADFTKLSPYGYIAFVPQWDFLDFINERARRYPWFRLLRAAEATELVHGNDRVMGVRATTTTGPLEVRATWSSRPTAATPPSVGRRAWTSSRNRRRSTCSGSGSRATRTSGSPSSASRPGTS